MHLSASLAISSYGESLAVVACENGLLVGVHVASGSERWRRQLPSACRGICQIPAGMTATSRQVGQSSSQATKRQRLDLDQTRSLLVCTASGSLHLLSLEDGSDVLPAVRLPCQVFCQPAVTDGCVWVGGRDDCLYSLRLLG